MARNGAPPNESSDALPNLRNRLRELHLAAGGPTYRQLHVQAALAGLHLPISTAQELVAGRRRPRWGTVEAFVVANIHHANSRRPPVELSGRLDDLQSWRQMYERADAHRDGTRSPDPDPPTGSAAARAEPRMDYLGFVLAVDAAHNKLRGVARARSLLPDRVTCANRAVDQSGLFAERERLLVMGAPAVVAAGERLFLNLIAIRDAVRAGAGLASAEYHRVYHPFAEALWAFRMAVRVTHGQSPLSPRDLDRSGWRDYERCPTCPADPDSVATAG